MTDRADSRSASAPLVLLLRIHLLQAWRRIKALRQQSRLLTAVIGSFIVGYLTLSYWLFSVGLGFLARFIGFGTVLTERLMYVLFAFLFALLLLSNLVIAYTNFFRNRETAFLLTLPVPRETIFRWKFIESALLASWAFVFLIAPLLAAFGQARGVPWHFYPVTFLLTAAFIILPGVAGAWLAIHLARILDRRSFQIVVVSGSLVLLGVAAFWWKSQTVDEAVLESRVLDTLDQLLVRTRLAEYPLLPSYWLSASVLQWADGALGAAVFYGLVLLSNVMFFGCIGLTRLGNSFYDTASAVQSRTGFRSWNGLLARRGREENFQPGLGERIVGLIPWLRRDTLALVIKDTRMFWRDTAQWGQSMMLFGLLGVYIINLRHFTHQLRTPFWITLVSYLNLSACSLNLATLTTRFVYPQFSLEGQRLWIVGMAPIGLRRVIGVKYWLATVTSLAVTLSLILLSCYLLRMTWDQLAFFGAVVAVMTFALNGLAVGLGVLYPNLKETNPNKIVSGFGGTLCLVLSFLYILVSVLVLGFGTAGFRAQAGWVVASIAVFCLLSAAIGWFPLKWGMRRANQIES